MDQKERIGHVHSIESFGTVDGPGVRFVVFLQGCPLRCKYCHNPDTWKPGIGTEMTADQILEQFFRNEPFYHNGGITVTGGEPLLQIDFVTELFTKAKARGVHTCVDTSGITFRNDDPDQLARFDALCAVTDLVLLDIKHPDPEAHKELTGHSNENILEFAHYLAARHKDTWIRHVVVPGITDNEEEWKKIGELMAHLPNVKALEVLPYHTMGIKKYETLGMDYPLKGVPALKAEVAKHAREVILIARRKALEHPGN
ncbi:pyruvate formate-lyase 1-activating enzyme [gut metagenome]|uniref:Pyruvate formate-lyase 1-activating enzyme n=1 Tax=gut metagenome TaxID=749906 RepID=J9GQ25_9ZZZZ